MKQLLAMISKGRDVPEFFPDVVKNVVVRSIEVKKLVYVYLVHYADFDANCREIALLSINSFQKDLSDSNQFVRGLALRVMTSVRVLDIIQIQLLAVRKCANDSSPYVRKVAATALPKMFAFDPDMLDQLKVILDKLLRDHSTMVLGSAMAAFNEICPLAYELLHPVYRKLCTLLADVDEWTQVCCLEVLTRYVRRHFTDPCPSSTSTVMVSGRPGQAPVQMTTRRAKAAFYSDDEDDGEDRPAQSAPTVIQPIVHDSLQEEELDDDHSLLLRTSLPLLKSRNSAVVLAVASLHYYCMPSANGQLLAKALVRILRNAREVQCVVLQSILVIARERPDWFKGHLREFFVISTDPLFNRLFKLDILVSLVDGNNAKIILKELEVYIKDHQVKFAQRALRAVGRVAVIDASLLDSCITGIMSFLVVSKETVIIAECVLVLRQLLQHSSDIVKVLRALVRLVLIEDDTRITDPSARASVIWLAGEYHEVLKKVALDILRVLANGFMEEEVPAKLQIMNLAVKLAAYFPDQEIAQALMTYVLELCRYDMNVDLRDRARTLTALMGLAPSDTVDEEALAELSEHSSILLTPKPPSVPVDPVCLYAVGSLSAAVGHQVKGYQALGDWAAHRIGGALRDNHASHAFPSSKGGDDQFFKTKNSSSSSGSDYSSSSGSESDSGSDSRSRSSSGYTSSDSEASSASSRSSRPPPRGPAVQPTPKPAAVVVHPAAMPLTRAPIRKVVVKKKADDLIMPMPAPAAGMGSSSSSAHFHGGSSMKTTGGLLDLPEPVSMDHSSYAGHGHGAIEDDVLGLGLGVDASSPAPVYHPIHAVHHPARAASHVDKVTSILDTFSLLDAYTPPPAPAAPMASPKSPLMPTAPAASPIASAPAPAPTPAITAEPKVIVRPELSGGLLVGLLLHADSPHSCATCCSLLLRNTKDYPIRRVRVSFPAGMLLSQQMPDLPLLQPGQSLLLPVDLDLTSAADKQIKVDVRSDRGSFVGTLGLQAADLLTPLPMTLVQFTAMRSSLIGAYNRHAVSYPVDVLQVQGDVLEVLQQRVLRHMTMYTVQPAAAGAGGEVLFAGKLRTKKSNAVVEVKVLVSISCDSSAVTLQVNCDDVICQSLHDEVRKIISRV